MSTFATMPNSGPWNRSELLSRTAWQQRIPRAVAAEWEGIGDRAANDPEAETFQPASHPRLMAWADEIRKILTDGEGVVWIRGLHAYASAPESSLDAAAYPHIYAALGRALGEPMTQYGVLYSVKDRGVDYTSSALPVSMTSAGTEFHTDSSSLHSVPDVVGLLCENPSHRGGASLVVHAERAYADLQSRSPALLRLLEKNWIRDLVTPGVDKCLANLRRNTFPIFGRDEKGQMLFRYMRYWIERGQERAGAPISPEARDALDTLDASLNAPRNVVSFDLSKGDILWVNNRKVAHNRTAFEDSADNVRVLQRMWLRLDR